MRLGSNTQRVAAQRIRAIPAHASLASTAAFFDLETTPKDNRRIRLEEIIKYMPDFDSEGRLSKPKWSVNNHNYTKINEYNSARAIIVQAAQNLKYALGHIVSSINESKAKDDYLKTHTRATPDNDSNVAGYDDRGWEYLKKAQKQLNLAKEKLERAKTVCEDFYKNNIDTQNNDYSARVMNGLATELGFRIGSIKDLSDNLFNKGYLS